MSEMMKVYQEINKRRQSDEMDVNSLTMFAEAWYFQQAKIDNLRKQGITQGQNFNDLAQKLKDVEYFNQKLQGRIDEVLKVCDNLRTDLIRENHVEYDKGWKDYATSIHHQLKGNKDDRQTSS